MIMTTLNIDTVAAPNPIKQKLRELSGTIHFEKQSRKGANGWLFFGINIIHNQRVAVKFYDWGGDPAFHAEPRTIALIDSENVITILDAAFVDDDYAYFVTNYYPKGDLDEELCRGVLGNKRGINLTRDVLSGLSFLHSKRLLHRDLKPQNILLSDADHAVIGDFGSVKRIPDGQQTVPGSGHSLIYRPPESVISGEYGVLGDIYQVGVLMYQLLGGPLPYEETAWLNRRELKQYRQIQDNVEKQLYANDVIKRRITHGQIIDVSAMPPWVCAPIRRTIAKACNVDPQKRCQSCADFLAGIASIRTHIRNWCIEEGCPTMIDRTRYRIVAVQGTNTFQVQKRRGTHWRYDNSFGNGTVSELVEKIETQIR